jgi:hypothetical protein
MYVAFILIVSYVSNWIELRNKRYMEEIFVSSTV